MPFPRFTNTNFFTPQMLTTRLNPRAFPTHAFNTKILHNDPNQPKQGIMLPMLLASGIGLSHRYFSKELDEIFGDLNQPVFGFRGGIALGVIIGLFMGVNYYEFFTGSFNALKNFFFWLIGSDVSDHQEKDKPVQQ